MNDTPDDPRDPELSRLFRKASSTEPSPVLDSAILAAARAAAAPQRPPRPWWRRLQAPFALAATVVLAVVLTLSMDRNPPPDGEIPATPSGKERPPVPEQVAPATRNAAEAPAPAAPAAMQGSPGASTAKAAPNPAADAESTDMLGSERRKPLAEPALEAKREAATPLLQKSPEAWLEEIRNLRRQGHPAKAERRLREFRVAYPDYALPEDLR